MTQTIEDCYTGAERHVASLNAFAKKHRLAGKAQADHVCYKCGLNGSFEDIRALIGTETDLVYQSIRSKRRIACVRSVNGVETVLGTITLLELSDQKPDGFPRGALDHIEVHPTACPYDESVGKLEDFKQVIKVELLHHVTRDIDVADGLLFRCARVRWSKRSKRPKWFDRDPRHAGTTCR